MPTFLLKFVSAEQLEVADTEQEAKEMLARRLKTTPVEKLVKLITSEET